MIVKCIGAIIIILVCGGWGIHLAAAYRRQESILTQLYQCIQHMRWELCYHLAALPELCRDTANHTTEPLRGFFLLLADNIDANSSLTVSGCVLSALNQTDRIPPKVHRILKRLGLVLGRYDLNGQLQGLDAVLHQCEEIRKSLSNDLHMRVKSYRTLGICSGVALAILFI